MSSRLCVATCQYRGKIEQNITPYSCIQAERKSQTSKTDPLLCSSTGAGDVPAACVALPLTPLRTPIVSSNVIALMFNEARIASLSASVGSSLDGTFADRMQHMSHNNKVDVLPETAILEICLTSYSADEIEVARSIVYKLLAPTKKFMRRKEGGEQKSIQDIIKLIKEFDPSCLPIFVAKDLNKIPPVSFNYIDSTSFLKEIAILRNDVASIKANKIQYYALILRHLKGSCLKNCPRHVFVDSHTVFMGSANCDSTFPSCIECASYLFIY
ncbi:unnamed protein product [Leptidea sinapis]|uniref:Uncharacterized protein n=1 Tax=Leptidea sinapis TaxID=189913 RepID=A0A5E4QLX8_9NEOP|nr:unnamed protein product [Leptidea sinapis]